MKTMKTTLLLLTMTAAVFAQGFPDGPGKALVETQCASCHGLEQIQTHRDSKDGWAAVVDYMVSRGMAATDEEVKTMVEYLAKSFPPAPKPDTAKGKSK